MPRKSGDIEVIYWAAPLFSQAERIWNRLCAKELEKYGFTVILPQDEAKCFETVDGMNFAGLAVDCQNKALAADLVVAILDGPDADSGTSMEAAMKCLSGGLVLGVRTDFRKAEDGQLNAMFRLLTKVMYFDSCDESYKKLIQRMFKEIKKLPRRPN